MGGKGNGTSSEQRFLLTLCSIFPRSLDGFEAIPQPDSRGCGNRLRGILLADAIDLHSMEIKKARIEMRAFTLYLLCG
jgi:hypothetical protein